MNSEAASVARTIFDLDGPYDRDMERNLFNFLVPIKAAARGGVDCSALLDMMRRGVETSNAAKRILLLSALGDISGEARWFEKLIEEAKSPFISFDDRHTIMVQTMISLFLNLKDMKADQFPLEQVGLRSLFFQLVKEMDGLLSSIDIPFGPSAPVKDRVVILTPQFLSPQHPTTLRVLEYARSLMVDFGKTPVIVEAHPFPRVSNVAFVPSVSINRNAELGTVDRVALCGKDIEYYRVASDVFGLADVVNTMAIVSILSPEFVIAISSPYLAAEAVALKFPTFSQPTTASAPITCRARSFSWNPLTPEERSVLESFGVADRHRFHMHPGFSLPEERPDVSRGDLGLPHDGFVFAVVGNRLDEEVDARFVSFLETLVVDPRAHVAMMGRFNNFERVIAQNPKLKTRVSFLGYREDILSVLRACDACVNPDRTGGGRSGAYALHAGLPVLSLPWGDVASIIGVEDCCADYAEMTARALRLMNDAPWHGELRSAAFARAGNVIGVKALVSRMIEDLETA